MTREIVVIDFEFTALVGERPLPVCVVAHELRSGRRFRLMLDQPMSTPPFAAGTDVLTVTFYGSAEWGCYLTLGWPIPPRIVDLYAEFRNRTNGRSLPAGRGLIGACAYFGLDTMIATEKREMQEAIGNGTWRDKYTAEQVLDYCESDVIATVRLFHAMEAGIDLPRALLRGRYTAAVAKMERTGVPLDVPMLDRLRAARDGMQNRLIARVNPDFGVFDGATFKLAAFESYLIRNDIPWPRLASGRLDLEDDTFFLMAQLYPQIAPLRELHGALADLRLFNLSVGRDGRNRTLLSPFGARSGRNTPSNSRFAFGPSVWMRNLIRPPPNYACVYIDYAQQEFGIAAALSGDRNMLAAYASGDPYLEFAKQARLVPPDATKASHPVQRDQCKTCILGMNYGMQAEALALRIGQPLIVARDLIRSHRETYRQFWKWSDAALDTAMLHGELRTVFGWRIHAGADANPRSLRNFPMQGNGSEMMRLAACLMTERGIEVAAPVHDAFLIIVPLDRLDSDIATAREAMAEASAAVLDGFTISTDIKVVTYPERYSDPRGTAMWSMVTQLLDEDEALRAVA